MLLALSIFILLVTLHGAIAAVDDYPFLSALVQCHAKDAPHVLQSCLENTWSTSFIKADNQMEKEWENQLSYVTRMVSREPPFNQYYPNGDDFTRFEQKMARGYGDSKFFPAIEAFPLRYPLIYLWKAIRSGRISLSLSTLSEVENLGSAGFVSRLLFTDRLLELWHAMYPQVRFPKRSCLAIMVSMLYLSDTANLDSSEEDYASKLLGNSATSSKAEIEEQESSSSQNTADASSSHTSLSGEKHQDLALELLRGAKTRGGQEILEDIYLLMNNPTPDSGRQPSNNANPVGLEYFSVEKEKARTEALLKTLQEKWEKKLEQESEEEMEHD